MNIKKQVLKLLICIVIFFVILIIANTFSKYLTEADGTANVAIARWRILVNGQDIRNNTNISQVITPVFYHNDNIADGIIAPRSTGYFDINIDCSAADVSFQYEINTSPNENSSVTDLIATGYSIDGGQTVSLNRGENIIKTVPLASHTSSIAIRVYIEWDDTSEDATMDNSADTNATKSGNDAMLDVNLSFRQIANGN